MLIARLQNPQKASRNHLYVVGGSRHHFEVHTLPLHSAVDRNL